MPEPIHLLLAAALPSAERRIATSAMEAATRRAMGATAPVGWKIPLIAPEGLWLRIEKEIADTKKWKPGWRKSMNEFLMHEGPSSILYLPSEHGMRIGETLGKVTKNLPKDARENLADLVSLNPDKATAALQRYAGILEEAEQLSKRLPSGGTNTADVQRTLHAANTIADGLVATKDFATQNAVPLSVAGLGAGALTLNAVIPQKPAFRRGFENAVQE